MCVYSCVCIFVFIHACVYVCVIHACVYLCSFMRVYIHACVYLCSFMRVYMMYKGRQVSGGSRKVDYTRMWEEGV